MVTLLNRPQGATIAAMIAATGWQSHSVRGFLAGVVGKKLGLTLQSDKTEGERVYRVICTGEGAKPQGPDHAATVRRSGRHCGADRARAVLVGRCTAAALASPVRPAGPEHPYAEERLFPTRQSRPMPASAI